MKLTPVTKKVIAAKPAPVSPTKEEAKYKLEASINAETVSVEGNDQSMFGNLPKPTKYVTKGIFKLTNKATGKSFEIVYPPYLSRKLLINPLVQTVQWKRMSVKVD